MVKCTCLTVATECTWKGVQQAADGHGFSPGTTQVPPTDFALDFVRAPHKGCTFTRCGW